MKVDIFDTDKKYNIIYADPAWRFSSKAYQNANRKMLKLEQTQYETMSIEEIKTLPVKEISEKNSVCFLWCVDSFLKEGISVLESWGFKYKTIAFNWIKHYASGEVCVNFAPYTLKSWEICLIGVRGSISKIKVNNNVK